MAVMDEFREEREQIKTAPLPKKIQYFKDYYLIPTLFTVFVVTVAVLVLKSTIFRREESLYVCMVNFAAAEEAEENVTEAFEKKALSDKKDYIVVDSNTYIAVDEEESDLIKYSYVDEEKLLAMVMSGSLDFLASGQDVVERYMEQDWFDDLSGILDPDLLRKLEEEDRILYKGSVPVAVSLDGSALVTGNFEYRGKKGEALYGGFPAGSQRRELAARFLDFLLGEQ